MACYIRTLGVLLHSWQTHDAAKDSRGARKDEMEKEGSCRYSVATGGGKLLHHMRLQQPRVEDLHSTHSKIRGSTLWAGSQ